MRKLRRSRFNWEGFVFVPITNRTRLCTKVVDTGFIFALCPNGFIATTCRSIFAPPYNTMPNDPEQFVGALFKLGVIEEDRFHELQNIIATNERNNARKRIIRDLRNAIDESGVEASPEQLALIREYFPE